MPDFTSPQGRRIAYDLTPGEGPGVVFLGGFRSDKEGTKALHLEDWAKKAGRAFLRFDYSGHGTSGGSFEDGVIGDWAEDAMAALSLTQGPQILVGSSMGGWISLLLARAMPKKVAGLVTIAAAPDFTEDGFWAGMTGEMRDRFAAQGHLDYPSDYGEPLRITRRLIEEGRAQLVLRTPLRLPFPVRFLQGTADEDVSVATALRLLEHAEGDDMRLTLVDGADHRFSTPDALDLILRSVEEVTARA
ncbi:alpha/beta hydrolase [Limimaricola hongkongensis]|uniref:Palmitoyl-protein thioesterase ABHD10, mitochondrial n=1 Tax=Limimaricola hongkongensis DSM 17492 TaxID=1122180 RepID=A0A017H9A9_9RHOB|nr:alpha/beta fold hydrolase [Limimaricola hongkongensis]EYD71042.1 2-hydroxymuconic semialdehyde hydrolase [Limimaricola hongkongensis DSM 17492]